MAFEHTDNNNEFNTCRHFASVKLFGVLENEVEEMISPALFEVSNAINIKIIANHYDILLKITSNGDKKEFDAVLKNIYRIFDEYIYADEDISLEQRLIDCMTLFSQQLVLFEQASGGLLSGKIAKTKSKNSCLFQAMVVPNLENVKKLKMCKNFDTTKIENLAKQIAVAMLDGRDNSMALSLLNENNNVVIALADNEKVNIFNHEFDTTNEYYLEDIVNTALFYLVKKSGQNDLKFY